MDIDNAQVEQLRLALLEEKGTIEQLRRALHNLIEEGELLSSPDLIIINEKMDIHTCHVMEMREQLKKLTGEREEFISLVSKKVSR